MQENKINNAKNYNKKLTTSEYNAFMIIFRIIAVKLAKS